MKSNNQSALSKKKSSGGIFETVKTIIYAVLIALVVRTVAYEPFNIPSGSMIPTLLVGDYLFVSKFSYGYSRYSLPFDLPLFSGRILEFGQPKRGDVMVFRLPSDPSTDFIKRIIGLPGDKVQMRDSNLFINDQMVPRAKVTDQQCPERLGEMCQLYTETLPGGVAHPIIKHGDGNLFDNTREFDVPPGHYFMMGDNRDNSDDSRDHVGFVPAENLVGRAQFVFFSTDGSARWWQIWMWPFAVRYDRLFHGID
ncbi:MAG TPA: signal peptidase I [Stellaceae bacterium]|jgi:signal peptidase I|nr:signal peptidase I [Stellaceae bacterium]